MDASSLEALVFDQSKFTKLSMEKKRELVYEISKFPDSATELLQSWSRQDILQILCAELGKEKKYTGFSKTNIIEQLLKIVYEKKPLENSPNISEMQLSSESGERTPKRQRKSDNDILCKNAACKAKMNGEDVFCKRCSCCICYKYDDNKDPSLWLICNSNPPFHGTSCGMSCHLGCVLRHENSGISKYRQDKGLDGSFCCVFCGAVNDLLSSYRKQLVIARDTRRVDELCYRLSLGQKILAGTKQYQNLHGILEKTVEKLEEDVGPLSGIPMKKARGIVNRLSSGPQVQRLCASAIESLDVILSHRVFDSPPDCNIVAAKLVKFEDIRASSITVILNSEDSNLENVVGYILWHRKVDDTDYPSEPTCRLFTSNTKFLLSGLSPATQYFIKVVTFDTERETGYCEFQFQTEARNPSILSPVTNFNSLSNPSSVENGINNGIGTLNGSDYSQKETTPAVMSLLDEERSIIRKKESSEIPTDLECVPYVKNLKTGLPITPYKPENAKEIIGKNARPKTELQAGSSSKKRSEKNREKECGTGDKSFEYYVKVMRCLEHDGYIETAFRQKFLSWYSLRATPREVRILKVFIDAFVEDSESLAEQLIDTFSDVISNKRCSNVPVGFCTKLWH